MKAGAGKARLAADLEQTAIDARANVAAATFDKETMRAAMAAAAREGKRFVVVTPGKPLDLRDTPAAEAGLEWLTGEGFRYRWDMRRVVEAVGDDDLASDLIVSWGKAPLPS